MTKKVYITKAGGEEELFSYKKLRKSLVKSGINRKVVEDVVGEIERTVKIVRERFKVKAYTTTARVKVGLNISHSLIPHCDSA